MFSYAFLCKLISRPEINDMNEMKDEENEFRNKDQLYKVIKRL
jgi:hypothetical protein